MQTDTGIVHSPGNVFAVANRNGKDTLGTSAFVAAGATPGVPHGLSRSPVVGVRAGRPWSSIAVVIQGRSQAARQRPMEGRADFLFSQFSAKKAGA
jgi:hypothetical protein